jgi:serine/threonine protein kinase
LDRAISAGGPFRGIANDSSGEFPTLRENMPHECRRYVMRLLAYSSHVTVSLSSGMKDTMPGIVLPVAHADFVSLVAERSGTVLDRDVCAFFMRAYAVACLWGHCRGVFNLDIKPDNLFAHFDMENRRVTPIAADFGHAHILHRDSIPDERVVKESLTAGSPKLPNSCKCVVGRDQFGTPSWRPPEASRTEWRRTHELDLAKMDAWGIGASFWSCLFGRFLPWSTADVVARKAGVSIASALRVIGPHPWNAVWTEAVAAYKDRGSKGLGEQRDRDGCVLPVGYGSSELYPATQQVVDDLMHIDTDSRLSLVQALRHPGLRVHAVAGEGTSSSSASGAAPAAASSSSSSSSSSVCGEGGELIPLPLTWDSLSLNEQFPTPHPRDPIVAQLWHTIVVERFEAKGGGRVEAVLRQSQQRAVRFASGIAGRLPGWRARVRNADGSKLNDEELALALMRRAPLTFVSDPPGGVEAHFHVTVINGAEGKDVVEVPFTSSVRGRDVVSSLSERYGVHMSHLAFVFAGRRITDLDSPLVTLGIGPTSHLFVVVSQAARAYEKHTEEEEDKGDVAAFLLGLVGVLTRQALADCASSDGPTPDSRQLASLLLVRGPGLVLHGPPEAAVAVTMACVALAAIPGDEASSSYLEEASLVRPVAEDPPGTPRSPAVAGDVSLRRVDITSDGESDLATRSLFGGSVVEAETVVRAKYVEMDGAPLPVRVHVTSAQISSAVSAVAVHVLPEDSASLSLCMAKAVEHVLRDLISMADARADASESSSEVAHSCLELFTSMK